MASEVDLAWNCGWNCADGLQAVRKRARSDHGTQFAGLRPRPGASHESSTLALDTQPIPLVKATLENARSWAVQPTPNGPNSIASAVMP